jgi:hypothetical protein
LAEKKKISTNNSDAALANQDGQDHGGVGLVVVVKACRGAIRGDGSWMRKVFLAEGGTTESTAHTQTEDDAM